MRVAFVLAQFPIRNESFIRRELEAFASQGRDGMVLALGRGDGTAGHEWPVCYAPGLLAPGLWAAQVWWLCRRPWAYLAVLCHVWAGCVLRPRVLLPALRHFASAAYFARVMHRRGVGRIHSHFAYVPGVVGLVAGRLARVPFSFTAHAWDIYAEPTMLRECLLAADRVTTCTRRNVAELHRLAPTCQAKVHLCYHGVPLDRFRFRKALTRDPAVLLCLGRLVAKKGHRNLLGACETLKRRGVAFQCRIVGDGPLRGRLERLVARRGLGREVVFVGYQPESAVIHEMREASVLVCPSVIAADGDRDGIPNVIIEALACGVPVVASRVSGIPEAVEDRVTGLLVEPGDAASLAEAIEDTLRQPDPAAARAEEGRRRAEQQFCVERNAARLAALIFG